MKNFLSLFMSIIMLISITAGLELTVSAETSGDFECDEIQIGEFSDVTLQSGERKVFVFKPDKSGWYVLFTNVYSSTNSTVTCNEEIPEKIEISESVVFGGERVAYYLESGKTYNVDTEFWLPYQSGTYQISIFPYYETETMGYMALNDGTAKLLWVKVNSETWNVPLKVDDYIVSAIDYCVYSNLRGYLSKNVKRLNISQYVDDFDTRNISSYFTELNVDSQNEFYMSENGVLFNKAKTVLISYPKGNESEFYEVPDSVVKIDVSAFENCNLVSIVIPNKTKNISDKAFRFSDSLKDVYYLGTAEQWNGINIGAYNEPLTNATIHYNLSEPETPVVPPTTEPEEKPTEPSTEMIIPTTQPTYPAETTAPIQPATQANITTTIPVDTQPQQSTNTAKAAVTKKPASIKVSGTVYKLDKNGDYVSSKVKKPSISKATKAKKSFKATWKKVSAVSGYEVQYSTSKKFTKKTTKTKTVKGNKSKTPSATIKNLKSKKTYYVRIRTYKTVKINGKSTKVYSSWSKVKSVKTK